MNASLTGTSLAQSQSSILLIGDIKNLVRNAVARPVRALQSLTRRRQLSRELVHVTREKLVEDLEALDLPEGAVLLVHTSLKRLGYVEGGPSSLVEALIEMVVRRRCGTLAMPCFSIQGSMHATLSSGRMFDVRSTPCNLGAIPETFRRYPGVRRSVHPTHSIAAHGHMADWIVQDHHLCGSSFGEGSPMVRMMELGGLLAGLGTNLGTVTFYHCLEDLETDFPISVYSADSPFHVRCLDGQGRVHEWELPAHAPGRAKTRIDREENRVIRSFFADALIENAGLRWFSIGRGHGWIVSMQDMYTECVRLMRTGVTIYSTTAELCGIEPLGAKFR
jgi:aminoglycoside N3'-acetyltransferase